MAGPLGGDDSLPAWVTVPAADARALIARAYAGAATTRPALGTIDLRPHQCEAVQLIAQTIDVFGGALLADDVGMGKTFTALASARHAGAVAVVAPATLRLMWQEAAKRAARPITVISYERLSAWRGDLPHVDFVIADEAHHVRNPRTRRYDAMARLTRHAQVLLLTATPLHNREQDLRHLLALFLGARAMDADDALIRACTVRRTGRTAAASLRLPVASPLRWLSLPHNERLIDVLAGIPAPIPPRDGGSADALLGILLLRLWSSSDAALRAALRRMLLRATALTAALQEGRYPRRDQLSAWVPSAAGLQLAFAELVVPDGDPGVCTDDALRRLHDHAEGLRGAIACLDRMASADAARHVHLERAVRIADGRGIVAFTQFEDTARALYRRLRLRPGVVMLSSRGGETAAGHVPRDVVVSLAHPDALRRPNPRLPLHLLLCTDLLSEGVNLGRLQHVIHLDLPWTPARAHQRLGRLLRPESPHETIDVSAFELPASAERMIGVLRTLQAKARASSRLLGSGDLLLGAPWSGDARRDDGSGAQLELDARLRDHLRRWLPHDAAPDAVNNHPLVAFVRSTGPDDWRALVLARVEALLRLVVVSEQATQESAVDILAQLSCFEGESPPDDRVLPRVARRVEAWLSAQRAATLVSTIAGPVTDAHTGALRALAHFSAALPRSERVRVAERLSRLRQQVLATRGAGAERALEACLFQSQLAQEKNPFDLLRRLDEVLGAPRGTTTDAPEPCILTVIVALPG